VIAATPILAAQVSPTHELYNQRRGSKLGHAGYVDAAGVRRLFKG
jgi:hypothetical protein